MTPSEKVQEYVNTLKSTKQRNVLYPFTDDILFMMENGLTNAEMHKFLSEQIKVSLPTVRNFVQKLKAQQNNKLFIQNKEQPINKGETNKKTQTETNEKMEDEEYVVSPFTGERMKKSELFGTAS